MRMNRRFLIGLSAVAVAAVIAVSAGLRPTPGLAEEVYAVDGIAIEGTDPVAYFTAGKPVAGNPANFVDWKGARWRFSNDANRALFLSNPEAYAPQFGGFCAWAVSEGYTASTDPEAWKIVDGKLYLNYSTPVQRKWEGDIPGNIMRGNANWPGLKG
jgi:hypothetical protein